MGMFDTIYYKCRECERKTSSQTKLGECSLRVFKIGNNFLGEEIYMNLILKNKCEFCKKENCINIQAGKINKIVSIKDATHKEGLFGNLEQLNIKEKQ